MCLYCQNADKIILDSSNCRQCHQVCHHHGCNIQQPATVGIPKLPCTRPRHNQVPCTLWPRHEAITTDVAHGSLPAVLRARAGAQGVVYCAVMPGVRQLLFRGTLVPALPQGLAIIDASSRSVRFQDATDGLATTALLCSDAVNAIPIHCSKSRVWIMLHPTRPRSRAGGNAGVRGAPNATHGLACHATMLLCVMHPAMEQYCSGLADMHPEGPRNPGRGQHGQAGPWLPCSP
jgi:hypothetical protein